MDNTATENAVSEKEKRKKPWLFVIIFVLLLGVIGYLLWDRSQDKIRDLVINSNPPPFVGGQLVASGMSPGLSEEEIQQYMQEQADANYFSFRINARPIFENGNAEGTIGIENPKSNTYPISVQILLDSTGETLFDTGGMMPNQYVYMAKLDKVLKKGEYSCTAVINIFSADDTHEFIGRQTAEVIITIQN